MPSLPIRPPRWQWPAFLQVIPDNFEYEYHERGHYVRCTRCWYPYWLAFNARPEERQEFVGIIVKHDCRHASRGRRAP